MAGASIKWADELEEVLPPWEMDKVVPSWDDPYWSRCKVKQVKQVKPAARPVRVRKPVHIKKEHTYPYLVPICTYLAMRLGEKEMKKLLKEEEVKDEQELEQKYMARIMREPGICKNPDRKEYHRFDVEKLGEGALLQRIRGWESGELIVSEGDGEKAQWFVTLLAMGPYSPLITTPITIKEQAKQDTGRGPFRGVEEEVHKILF